MPLALDTILVIAAGIALPSIVFWSSYRTAVNKAQRRLYRQAFLVGALLAGLLDALAWASAKGAVPFWLAGAAVGLCCVSLLPALSWLRRELALRAREPYADLFT
jgi:hypothetical protein